MAFPVQSTGRFANAQKRRATTGREGRGEGAHGPAINVYDRLIEIYVLIHSRIGGAGEQIVPAMVAIRKNRGE